MKAFTTTLQGLFAAVLILALSGCATKTSEIDSVRQLAQQALDAANAAASKADQAANTAQNASRQAQDASTKASSAMQAAQDAKSCCDDNSQKIERMLERSMRK